MKRTRDNDDIGREESKRRKVDGETSQIIKNLESHITSTKNNNVVKKIYSFSVDSTSIKEEEDTGSPSEILVKNISSVFQNLRRKCGGNISQYKSQFTSQNEEKKSIPMEEEEDEIDNIFDDDDGEEYVCNVDLQKMKMVDEEKEIDDDEKPKQPLSRKEVQNLRGIRSQLEDARIKQRWNQRKNQKLSSQGYDSIYLGEKRVGTHSFDNNSNKEEMKNFSIFENVNKEVEISKYRDEFKKGFDLKKFKYDKRKKKKKTGINKQKVNNEFHKIQSIWKRDEKKKKGKK